MGKKYYLWIGSLVIPFGLLALVANPIVLGSFSFITKAPNYDAQQLRWSLCFFLLATACCFCVARWGYRRGYPEPTRLIKLLTCVFFVFTGLISLELLLRIRPLLTNSERLAQSPAYDPSAFALNHFASQDRDVFDVQGKLKWSFSGGYHGPDFALQKPAGQIRIVFLGGSFVWADFQSKGLGYGESANWVEKIESKLQAKGYEDVEVINAGTPGHRTFDSLGRYLAEIHLFDPDFVFVCHAWNDMKYFWDYTKENSPLRSIHPQDQSSHQYLSGISWLFDQFQMKLRTENIFDRKRLTEWRNNAEGQNNFNDNVESRDASIRLGRRQFELNLKVLSQLIRETDAVPILLSQPRLPSLHNTKAEREKIEYAYQGLSSADHELLCNIYDSIDDSVEKVSKDSGSLYFDLAADTKGKNSLFVDHVHLSTVGGEVVSTRLAEYIEVNFLKH